MQEKVLVVDDEESVRQFLSSALESIAGFKVVVAESAEEALRILERERFDLVLTDWRMPGMDGFALVSELARTKPEIPTVIMTGYGSIDSAVEAMKLGACDYVTKPFDLHTVVERLKKVLDERDRFARLKNLSSQLEHLEQMKSEFLSFASHELKTPLTVIKSAVQRILDGGTGELNPLQRNLLAMTDMSINRLTEIVRNLVLLCQIKSGKLQMHPEEIDPCDLLNFVVSLARPQLEERSISLRKSFQKSLPGIYVDREKAERMLINILESMVRLTPDRGDIFISARHREKAGIVISVKTNGDGSVLEKIRKVVESPEIFSPGSEPGADGVTVGLAVAKALARTHGGDVSFHTVDGKTGVLTLTLPGQSRHTVESLRAAPPPPDDFAETNSFANR